MKNSQRPPLLLFGAEILRNIITFSIECACKISTNFNDTFCKLGVFDVELPSSQFPKMIDNLFLLSTYFLWQKQWTIDLEVYKFSTYFYSYTFDIEMHSLCIFLSSCHATATAVVQNAVFLFFRAICVRREESVGIFQILKKCWNTRWMKKVNK